MSVARACKNLLLGAGMMFSSAFVVFFWGIPQIVVSTLLVTGFALEGVAVYWLFFRPYRR